jgi:hypothetical protein
MLITGIFCLMLGLALVLFVAPHFRTSKLAYSQCQRALKNPHLSLVQKDAAKTLAAKFRLDSMIYDLTNCFGCLLAIISCILVGRYFI